VAKKTSKKTGKKTGKKKSSRRKPKVEAASRGLEATELAEGEDAAATALARAIEDDGGSVLARYRDPLGGHWHLFAALPVERVGPTPFQRDLSATHAKRMTGVIDKLDRFLDPLIVVRNDAGEYWTPNGLHRLTAMKELGARSITCLVLPDFEVCYKILALNTEKAHNLKEKSLEVIRMARSLAELGDRPERDFEMEFEEPGLLTLGLCYEQRARFSGSAYNPIVKRCEGFMDAPLSESLAAREERATALLAVDDEVARVVKTLKERGIESPYLKNFVVARINPLRWAKGPANFEETLEKMRAKAESFAVEKVTADMIRASGGGGSEE
jgi:ParB family chromosome partitioning protein